MSVEIDWPNYDECSRCPAQAGMPCIGGRPHEGRLYNPGRHSTEVTDAVVADLESLDVTKIPGGRTYRALALWLAGTIDKRGDEDGPSVTAKLAERLQATMTALTRKGDSDDDSWQRFEDGISTPVR